MESDKPDEFIDVNNILAEAENEKKKYKSTEVVKEVDPQIDVGSLLLTDLQPVEISEFRKGCKAFLDHLARENTQLLINEIWKLPIERVEDAIVAKLPTPSTVLPREKPIPKQKALTKWEKFAREKGIQKRKRGRMVWDEEAKKWKPRYGYKRVDDDKAKWLLEVPDNADPYEDQFEKRENEKRERVAKNELQRLRNIARNQKVDKGNILSTEFKPTESKDKDRLVKEIDIAKSSTASVGKFQPRLPKEKEGKQKGQKRKFEPVSGEGQNEKKRALDIWNKIYKPEAIDITKAVNKFTADSERSSKNKLDKSKRKGKGGKTGKQQNSQRKGKRSRQFGARGGKVGKPRGGKAGKPRGKK